MTTYKLNDLAQLVDAINMGLDIEFFIRGTRYNISWANKLFICTCPDGDAVFFNDTADLLNNYKIDNVPLKALWMDMDIYSM